MPRKSNSIETGLTNTSKALKGALRIKKALKKTAPKKTAPKSTDFNFGANAQQPEPSPYYGKPLRPKIYKLTSLPQIKDRKTIASFANEIEKKAPQLDKTLKPGQRIAIQIRGAHDGKKFTNKSVKTFGSYQELARFLRGYEKDKKSHTHKSRKDQAALIDSLYIAEFNEYYDTEYERLALVSQYKTAMRRRKRAEKYKAEEKKKEHKIKESEKVIARERQSKKELQAKLRQQERTAKQREKKLLSSIEVMAKQVREMQKQINKLTKSGKSTKKAAPKKGAKKSNAKTKPAGKKRATNSNKHKSGKAKR